jgi:hypothetical protein
LAYPVARDILSGSAAGGERGSPVEIGKPQRKYTIEPIRDPVPQRREPEQPKAPKPPVRRRRGSPA